MSHYYCIMLKSFFTLRDHHIIGATTVVQHTFFSLMANRFVFPWLLRVSFVFSVIFHLPFPCVVFLSLFHLSYGYCYNFVVFAVLFLCILLPCSYHLNIRFSSSAVSFSPPLMTIFLTVCQKSQTDCTSLAESTMVPHFLYVVPSSGDSSSNLSNVCCHWTS